MRLFHKLALINLLVAVCAAGPFWLSYGALGPVERLYLQVKAHVMPEIGDLKRIRITVHDRGLRNDHRAIVRAEATRGCSPNIGITAEGVETSEQLEQIRAQHMTRDKPPTTARQ